ncbi:MAG TPA: CoA transferase, partial [Longimicrobium sp.]|nr:CoA transferase [Longimicrobium sp.]
WGADVLKVEHPVLGDPGRMTSAWGVPSDVNGVSHLWEVVNRGKRAMTLNMKAPRAAEVLERLVRRADVVLHSFLPATASRLGISYERFHAFNPRLVFCSITGYGSDGPGAGRPGYDFAVQARAGWMAITGDPEGAPVKVGVAIVDVLTGQNAAVAILAALRERDRTGRGQRVEVSLFDSALAGLVNVTQAALVTGREPVRWGNAHPTIVPYQAFAAADRPFVLAVGNDAQWRRACAAIGATALAADTRFAANPGRVEHRAEISAALTELFQTRPAADWLARLEAAGVPCAPVQSVGEALRDPIVTAREGLWTMEGPMYGQVQTVASPLRFAETPAGLAWPAPALGEHTEQVVREGWG